MTTHLTGPDVQPDVRASLTGPDQLGRSPTGEATGAAAGGNVAGPPISLAGDRQDGGMEPVEPRGRWWTPIPLRVRLVAASLALVLFALVVIGTCSAIALHSYLLGRVDSQVT